MAARAGQGRAPNVSVLMLETRRRHRGRALEPDQRLAVRVARRAARRARARGRHRERDARLRVARSAPEPAHGQGSAAVPRRGTRRCRGRSLQEGAAPRARLTATQDAGRRRPSARLRARSGGESGPPADWIERVWRRRPSARADSARGPPPRSGRRPPGAPPTPRARDSWRGRSSSSPSARASPFRAGKPRPTGPDQARIRSRSTQQPSPPDHPKDQSGRASTVILGCSRRPTRGARPRTRKCPGRGRPMRRLRAPETVTPRSSGPRPPVDVQALAHREPQCLSKVQPRAARPRAAIEDAQACARGTTSRLRASAWARGHRRSRPTTCRPAARSDGASRPGPLKREAAVPTVEERRRFVARLPAASRRFANSPRGLPTPSAAPQPSRLQCRRSPRERDLATDRSQPGRRRPAAAPALVAARPIADPFERAPLPAERPPADVSATPSARQ